LRRDYDDVPPIKSFDLPADAVADLARAALGRLADGRGPAPVSPEFLDGFCRLLLADDAVAAERVLNAMTHGRAGAARLADGILAAVARHLGETWDTNGLSFAEVSIAVARLARFRQRHALKYRPLQVRDTSDRVVFAALPGEAHNLGLILAAEAFRQEDWDVTLLLDHGAADIVDRSRRLRPRAVGFSISTHDRAHHLRHVIGQIAAFPYRVRILVGGGAATEFVTRLPEAWNVHAVADIAAALESATA